MSLEEVFSRSAVMALAGPAVYGRGVAYFREGRVAPEAGSDVRLRATVRGSVPYTVEVWDTDGQLGWSCTCPYAEDGSLCKHVVAVTLLLDDAERDALVADPPGAVSVPVEDGDGVLIDHVAGLDRQRLVELVLEAADADWRLRERLLAEAVAARGEGPELETWRRRIDAVFAPYDDFVHYREAAGWAGEVGEVIDALAELCAAGHPDAVAVLAEHAHRRADAAIGYVDDSDGWLTEIAERLAQLHLRACVEGDPDPVQLAGRLAQLELTSELDGFRRAAATYAEVLGSDGLAAYRRLLDPQWEEVRSQTVGWSSHRYTLREAMAGVALAAGDADALIEVYRDDLWTPDEYLQIARVLVTADRDEEAARWAREGLEIFADRSWQTPPLREFLAGLLRDRGDRSAARELFREAFDQAPSLSAYRRLLDEAGEDAAEVGTRALDALAQRVAQQPADETGRSGTGLSGVLVEILAYEGETEHAWQVATEHGCGRELWLTLARAREDTAPLDAIGVYEREVFAQIEAKKNHTYRQAVELLGRIRRLAAQAGQPERFASILGRVRGEHGRKRNLIKLIDRKGW